MNVATIQEPVMDITEKKARAETWFRSLRDSICEAFEELEHEYAAQHPSTQHGHGRSDGQERAASDSEASGSTPDLQSHATFEIKPWDRAEGGGGEIGMMKGRVFEKVGVNISTVHGEFSEKFRHEIPGAANDPRFWASGISLVAHMASPLVPAAHFNTRMIVVGNQEYSGNIGEASRPSEPSASGAARSMLQDATSAEHSNSAAMPRIWFGGGGDLNPMYPVKADTDNFHEAFKHVCDDYDAAFYPDFKAWCDEYFFIPHRNEARGVGGIFYDYLGLNSLFDGDPIAPDQFGRGGVGGEATQKGMVTASNAELDWNECFAFTKAVGEAFRQIYPALIQQNMFAAWTPEQRAWQLEKRGRYAEYNLLYDRGTRFGLMTGGNPEAILMSLPPEARWP
jgi:coproporphyrinogen III oxidase